MTLNRFLLAYSVLFILIKNVLYCQEIDKRSSVMLDNILNELHGLGYSQINQDNLLNPVLDIINGDIHHFNTYCVNSLLNYYRNSPNEIWVNEQVDQVSIDKIVQNFILVCRELPEWQNVCQNQASIYSLIATDIHLAILLTFNEKPELSNISIDIFCNLDLNLSSEDYSSYNHLCVERLASNDINFGVELILNIRDSLTICSTTTLWSKICTNTDLNNYADLPELHMLASSLFFEVSKNDRHLSNLNGFERISPTDFCEISEKIILKGDVMSYFNVVCVGELSLPSKITVSGTSWLPSTNSVIEICKNNPLWISCVNDSDDKTFEINSFSDNKELSYISINDKISLLATSLLQQIHQLPTFMFSSLYYKFASINDICNISGLIYKDISGIQDEEVSTKSQLNFGQFFNSICWRNLSTRQITFNTNIGVISHPIKTLEAVSVCNSSTLFWVDNCKAEESESLVYLPQISILSQELLISSKKYYSLPANTFCVAAKNIILTLNRLNNALGSSASRLEDYSINWLINNINKFDSYTTFNGITSGYFNRECVRELIGKNENNTEYIPINFAIFICSSSLRWERCPVNGNIKSRYLTEFVASEFYYGLLAEMNINLQFNWNDICLISESTIPEEYNSIDSFPVIPYFNHFCSLSFIKNLKMLTKKYNISFSENKPYTFTNFIKVCVHNYFWRVPCGEIVESDLLANSLLYGSHQFASMQNVSESQFCKAANNLLDVDPKNFEGECIRELMEIGTQFTSEVAEGACASTHRSLVCHGYPDEYSSIATTLFTIMYQHFPVSEIASFIEFCEIVHSIFTDNEFNASPNYFNAICARHIHNSNLEVSFLTISILCSHISPNSISDEDYTESLLVSEFYKKSRSIHSLKKWEVNYFYPLAKSILESLHNDQHDIRNFNYNCVALTRSIVSTDSYVLKLDDAVSLCSGSIAFKIYCKDQNPSIQHLVSEIIQGITLIYKIEIVKEYEILSICNAAQLIYNASVEKQPTSRDVPNMAKKYPYFLNSCVEVLTSGIILPNKFIEIPINDAISICTQSLRSSVPCKNERPIVSAISVGLYTEMQHFPELNKLKVTDLCNIASKIADINLEYYLDACSYYLDNFKSYIPTIETSKIKLTEIQKQRICTRPFKWPKCNIHESLMRGVHSIKIEKLASKLREIFHLNNINIWKFERYCVLAEKLLNKGENDFKKCLELLEEFEYIDIIKQTSKTTEAPLFLHYKLESTTKNNICSLISSNSNCIHSRNGLSGLFASNFYSISTKYLDLNTIKSSDFCIISELLLQKGSMKEIKESCPYILLQITNLEHWPQILLTPELTHTICDSLSITNLNCIPPNSDWGITEELSSGINNIAIELFFIRKKYVPTFNPESSCEMAESLIQFGIKNVYFNRLCINLISYDIWNFSENFNSRYNNHWNNSKQDPETFFQFIKSEATNLCKELERKLSDIYLKSHNYIQRKKRDSKIDNMIYYQKVLKRTLNPLNLFASTNDSGGSGKLTKKEERIELKKRLKIISKAKGYVALNDEAIKDYSPEMVDYKLAKKYFAYFPEDIYKLNENSNFIFKMPEFNWSLFSEKLSLVSKNLLGVSIKVSDPKFGGLAELIQKWGYSPQGTVQGAQYIYRVYRYINKYMISPKKAYLIWKETLIAMNFVIIPKWRDSWQDEIRKPSPLDEQPLPSCEGIKASKVLKQLGMDRKKISMVALANIDSFVAQMTEAAHDLKLSNVKFNDLCLVGIILFNIKSYSRTESFNYQCTKWVKEIGYVDDYVENTNTENVPNLSKKIVNRLKNSVRKQIPTVLARKICASTNRWMSCNSGKDIEEKLNIDNLATELVRLSRISGLEFRDMCEVSIQIANAQDFNQKCPVILQQIIGNYNRSHQICRSTSYWKSCKYSKAVQDLKLKEHLDVLTSELTIGLNEIFPNIFTFEEICYLSSMMVASEYFKTDCVRSMFDFLVSQRFIKPALNIYADVKPSVSFKHIVSVSLTICYDTLRWQQATCVLEGEGEYSLYEKQWIDLVSEEILKEMIELSQSDSYVSIFFKDKERDKLLERLNNENGKTFKINLPPSIKYRDICNHVTKISKTRYFNINCVQAVTEIFQTQISKITLYSEKDCDLETNNVYASIIKTPSSAIIEKICKGSIFWETCSNKYLHPLFNFYIENEKKESVDIVVNDLMVSTLQLSESNIESTNVVPMEKLTQLNNIHKLASRTVSSLSYLDFCEIGIWFSNEISKLVNGEHSKLQNLLSEKILVLILENMYPNRKTEKKQEIENFDDEDIGTIDQYIENSIQKLPKVSPILEKPPYSLLRNVTKIETILVNRSENYSSNLFKVELSDYSAFQDFYVKRDISIIDRTRYGKFLYVKPIIGLRLSKYKLPDGSTRNSSLIDMGNKNKTISNNNGTDTEQYIANLMTSNPNHFHRSILPHATKQILDKKNPTLSESKIKKKWYRDVRKDYYYIKGREIAKKEWGSRQIALSNNNGTGEITWETEKRKVPSFIRAMFSSEVRKRRDEGKLFNKGLYKARVHQFLLEKLANDMELRGENRKDIRKSISRSNSKATTQEEKDKISSLEGIYSEEEVSVVINLALLIVNNNIAVDLL